MNIRQFKKFHVYHGIKLDIKNKKNYKNYKHMEIEQYLFEWSVGHWRNQGETEKFLKLESVGCSKGSSKREVDKYEYIH
jgi:hypothetical protein